MKLDIEVCVYMVNTFFFSLGKGPYYSSDSERGL